MFKGIKYDLTTILPGPLVENAEPTAMFGITDLSNITAPLVLEQSIGWSAMISNTLASRGGAYFKSANYFIAVSGRIAGLGAAPTLVYYSPNLVSWGSASIPFNLTDNPYCVHRGYFYVFRSVSQGVWRSEDGLTWTLLSTGHAYATTTNYAVFSFQGNIILAHNDQTWISRDDGLTFSSLSAATGFGDLRNAAPVVFKGRMYLLGGRVGAVYSTGGYYSDDGITWTPIAGVFSAITGYATAVVADNKIIVAGGTDGVGSYYNTVRSSSDGLTWANDVSNTMPSGRLSTGLIQSADKVWVFGGEGAALTPATDTYSYSLGIDYYLNGTYIDRTDPDVQIYSDGYYEIQALYENQIKLARFCFTASGAWKPINLFNTKTVCQFKGNTLARPATFKRITLTAPWEIKFICRADYAPGEILGDSVTGNAIQIYPDPSVRVDTGAGFVTLAISLDSNEPHSYIFNATSATNIDVYQDGNLEGTLVMATTTISLNTLGGGANGVAATNQGYMYNLRIYSGGDILNAPMDESLTQITDQFIDHSSNENHIQVDSSGILATDTIPVNGNFTNGVDWWNQYLPFNGITVVDFMGRTDVLRVDSSVAANYFYQPLGLKNGNDYEISLYVNDISAQPRCIIGSSPGDTDILNTGYMTAVAWELKTFTFTAPDDHGYIAFDCDVPGIYYIDTLSLKEASTECQIIPVHDVTADAISGNTLRVYNATTKLITEYTIRNSAYSDSNLTKVFTTTALATSSGVALAAVKEAIAEGLSDMLLDFNSDSVAPRSVVKSLARANISKLTDKLGSNNKIDINVISPVIISIYDGELLIDKVVAGNPNFDNNYQVKVIRGRKISIWDDSTGIKQLDKYLTYSGV